MKKHFILLSLILVCIFANSFKSICVFSIDASPVTKIDSSYLGSWQIIEDAEKNYYFTIEKYNNYSFLVSYKSKESVAPIFNKAQSFISILDSNIFLNIAYIKGTIKGYTFIKISDINTTKHTMTLSFLKDPTFEFIDNRISAREMIHANLNNPNFYEAPLYAKRVDSLK